MPEHNAAVKVGTWADGAPVGTGHIRPYLQPKYARTIANGSKSVEGRPCTGWAARVRQNDYVRFKMSGGSKARLAVRVRTFASFYEMLLACGVRACLSGFVGDVAAAAEVYYTEPSARRRARTPSSTRASAKWRSMWRRSLTPTLAPLADADADAAGGAGGEAEAEGVDYTERNYS